MSSRNKIESHTAYSDKSHIVYINPNFNKSIESNSGRVLHVNPKFSHLLSHAENRQRNKPKIYVNPNFLNLKNENTLRNMSCRSSFPTKGLDPPKPINPTIPINTSQPCEQNSVHSTLMQAPVSKSRYHYVRQNITKQASVIKDEASNNHLNTIKISKYKSISLKNIKQNLETKSKNISTIVGSKSLQIRTKPKSVSSMPQNNLIRYKLTKYRNLSLPKNSATKINTSTSKSVILCKKDLNRSQMRVKIMKKVYYKKNNIPCPLFRKFGKCLRNMNGKCDFLHERKHVSICRKFIKGICHDKDCLFSHDLTKQKMPTCYFYLQGACIRKDCPYLHVKLNDNVKLCPDFLKGYCEKGSKCLKRHVDVEVNRENITKSRVTKNTKINNNKPKRLSNLRNNEATVSKDISTERYYQEYQNDSSKNDATCEMIKPTRCKLGNLPSFIQL